MNDNITFKNPSPYLKANFLSRFFHCWLGTLLKKSKKQPLEVFDLYDLLPTLDSVQLTDTLERNWFDEVRKAKEQKRQPSLLRATVKLMGFRPLLIGLCYIPDEFMKVTKPLLLAFLLAYFLPCTTMSTSTAWLLASGIVLCSIFSSILYHPLFYAIQQCAMQLRIAYTGLLYRKILRLSSQSMNKTSSGQITNLLSNDASQIEMALIFINYLWLAPFGIVIVVITLWYFVRYIALIPIAYTLALLCSQLVYGRLFVKIRSKILQVMDERLKIMSEIIKSMRIVKMYCWEESIEHKIKNVRKREIIRYSYRLILDCVQTLFSHTYANVVFLLMYGAMWYLNIALDTKYFTISYCLLAYLRLSVVDFFNYAVRNLVQYLSARKRIEAFLLLPESEQDARIRSRSFIETVSLDKSYILVNNYKNQPQLPSLYCDLKVAKWEMDLPFTLKNIEFNTQPGDIIAVIGPVGSGKSSLLQTLCGEIPYFDGKISLNGRFCYVPQESWIFSSSLKQNILFGKEYNSALFKKVIHASALDKDFCHLSHGEYTVVGDQGVMLSGGQKARVNMARALYQDADIYLLDDPLSAVDVKVGNHLFEKCIKGLLKRKICILVTHQIQYLKDATKIIVLNNGEGVAQGTYEELLKSSFSFAKLLEDIHQHEHNGASGDDKRKISLSIDDSDERAENGPLLRTQSSRMSEDETNNNYQAAETKATGVVKWHVFLDYFRAGAGLILGFVLIFVVFTSQQAVAIFSNWWLAKWSNEEELRYQNSNGTCRSKVELKIQLMSDNEWQLYRNQKFYIYSGSVAILFIITLIRVVSTEFLCINAARVLHNR
ncbi:unnamed protein product [Didymodactylos carnosus]|uniref:Multidrug resistance-associated protein 4 n=1 Tax=Didymodactylos carnosus TaxID=1234261 RepID=A0A8S2DZF0_9BILA|nr:unnamed protein product [Didymodactylos carnosus]CAF3856040.1 unnamed protein product [Didymodactylos carnosus]